MLMICKTQMLETTYALTEWFILRSVTMIISLYSHYYVSEVGSTTVQVVGGGGGCCCCCYYTIWIL